MYAYAQMGVSLPHSSYAMWGDGVPVPRTSSSRATSSSSTGSATSASTSAAASSSTRRTPARRAGLEPRLGLVRVSYVGARRVIVAPRIAGRGLRRSSPLARRRFRIANAGTLPTLSPAHAHNLERIHQLRPRQHPGRARACDGVVGAPVGRPFKMLHRECLTPIKQKRWCPVHDVELSARRDRPGLGGREGAVRAGRGRRARGAREHDTSRAIEITQFVPAGEVDPIYFDRTYFLVPAAHRGAAAAVRAAARGDAGAGRGRARLVRARRQGEALPDPPEGRRARARDAVPRRGRAAARRRSTSRSTATGVKKEELELARQIIAGPRRRRSTRPRSGATTARSCASCSRRSSTGDELAAPEPETEDAPVVDLMEALRASVAAAQRRAGEEAPHASAPRPASSAAPS